MADAFDLGGILDLDAGDFSGGADEAAAASDDVAAATGDMSDSLLDVEPAGIAAGGALAGIGTAAQGMLDDTQETRESLGRTATTMGLTSDEAEDLATSMSDATFPLDDVTGAMDALAQQGIHSEDVMEDVAMAADMVADATGSTATSIAESAGPALRAMGEDVEDLSEHMDTFTFVARNTTMDVEDFSQVVTKVGPEIEEMGMSVDETATIMAALEEKGLDSRTAMREFRQAANNADGDQEALMESLGLTTDELEEQEAALEDAEGMTEEHAEAANESLSTMDELRASFDDAKLAASEYLGPLSALAPAAQTAGIALMGMSAINVGAVAPSFATVAAAALPVTAAVLGIAAASAVLYAAWERDLGGIQGKTQATFDWITARIDDFVGFVESSIATVDYILTDWSPRETIEETAGALADIPADFLSDSWNAIIPANVGIDPVTLPTVEVDAGPLGSATVGGQTIFEGFSFDLPQLATGGLISGPAPFIGGEEGEELVLNAEQTSNVKQGEVDLGGGSSERVEELLERVVTLLEGPQQIGGQVQFDPSDGMLQFVDGRIGDANEQQLRQFQS